MTFDPFEPGFVAWPYDQYSRLRDDDPVHWSQLLEGWVVTRYADASAVLRDPTTSVELDNASPTAVIEMQRERMRIGGRNTLTLVLRDDPEHGRVRRLLTRPFGPRPVERLRAMVAEHVDAVLDPLLPKGSMDVVADYAYPLPVTVFCDMLGFPTEESSQFREWTSATSRNLDPVLDDAEHARCAALIDEMYTYLEEQAADRRAQPRDDLLSELVNVDGDGWASTEEMVAQLVTLYVAGHEPTMSLIGTGLLGLLQQPEQLALLRERPELLPNAVHELLRYDGPNQFVRRFATQPMQVGDREVAKGDAIYVGIGAANHDPERWEDPDAIRVDRSDAPHHLQFGSGTHSCLGAHLARLQAEVALGALVTRLDGVELAGDPVWSERMVIRGLQSLPVRFR